LDFDLLINPKPFSFFNFLLLLFLFLFHRFLFLFLLLLFFVSTAFIFCLKSETSFFLKRLKYGVRLSFKVFDDLGKRVPPFLFDVI